MSDQPTPPDELANPFAPTAVAQVWNIRDAVTIETGAIRDARRFLYDYLNDQDTAAADGAGATMALVGEHGSGKSHLAALLRLDTVASPSGTPVIYLDTGAKTFAALHQALMAELKEDDLRERVREYYASVVARSLSSSDFSRGIAELLRSGELSPEFVVERLGLAESTFLDDVRGKLGEVTRNDAFATALTLLLRSGFDNAVWSWMRGGEPAEILRERGITTALDDEESAIEAVGVLATVLSLNSHHFVLIIDELDKILAASGPRPQGDRVAAFQKLLETLAAAGALLVVAVLPDFLMSREGRNLRDRVGHTVLMSRLGPDEVTDFIIRSQGRVLGREQLRPFTVETVRRIVSVSRGAPRQVLRLCRVLFRMATDDGVSVTEDMVLRAGRDYLDNFNVDDVQDDIRRALQAARIHYQAEHLFSAGPRVDYWIPVRGDAAGCAVVVRNSIVEPDEVRQLRDLVAEIRAVRPESQVLLVVNGYLQNEYAVELGSIFSTDPLIYKSRTFPDEFPSVLRALLRRLEHLTGTDPLLAVREQVDQVGRDQGRAQDLLEGLSALLVDFRSSVDRRLSAIELSAQAAPDRPSSAVEPATGWMPDPVAGVFDRAQSVLADLDRLRHLLDAVFAGPANTARVGWVIARLRSEATVPAAGVSVILQNLVAAFADAVGDWCHRHLPERATFSRPSEQAFARLDELCTGYDLVFERIPWNEVAGLADLVAPLPDDEGPRPTDGEQARDTLSRLSVAVRDAMLLATTRQP